MARKEMCILTNMCMVYDGDKVLIQKRNDPDWPGVVFPGGHVEPKESFTESVIREVREETGLDISNVKLCGIKQWTHRAGEYRYVVLMYKTDTFSGELSSSTEGEVFWISKEDIYKYTLADGFECMLEVFLNDDLTETYHWFEDGQWKAKNI